MANRPKDPMGARGMREPGTGPAIAPLIDVYETEAGFILLADLPGVRPEGLDVVAERDVLTIRGRVTRPERPPEHQEFELVDYFQTLALTEDLDANGVSAALKDGVLRITIPKSATAQPKKIHIKVD